MAVRLELQPGEQRLAELRVSPSGTYMFYLLTLGLWELWRRRKSLIVTDRRVVMTQGIMSNSQKSLPVERIQDATVVRVLFWGSVKISSAGGTSGVENFGPAKLGEARNIAHQILNLSSQHRSDGLGASAPISAADELTKLAELHEKGLLSAEEFNVQKARLLQ